MNNEAVLAVNKVTLRPLSGEDVPLLARWFIDPEVVRWLQLSEDPPSLRTIDAVRERFERMQADPATRLWRIDAHEGKPIGQVEMVDIHPLQKRAELHLCIGEKEYWSGGYGSDAIRCVQRYGFESLGLRRIYISPDADNARAIRSFAKCGFVKEGVLRAHRLRYGQPVDMIIMGILREEFTGW